MLWNCLSKFQVAVCCRPFITSVLCLCKNVNAKKVCMQHRFLSLIYKLQSSLSVMQSRERGPPTTWDVNSFVCSNKDNVVDKFGLVVLNQPVEPVANLCLHLSKNAAIRIVVDGGATQWYQVLKDREATESEDYLPHVVCGDFDSLTADVKQFYRDSGCEIIYTPDQDATDFTKSLEVLAKRRIPSLKFVCVVVDTGGRLDHIMGNINTLFYCEKNFPVPVYLLAHTNLSWLLPPGKHIIKLGDGFKNKHCGLIPIGEPCPRVTTTGLWWNMITLPADVQMKFGGLVSVCNRVELPEVTVDTDSHLLWTLGHDYS